jgi:membrane dipeptidase
MLIVDGHLDLAMNAVQGNRNLLASAYTTRTTEFGIPGKGMAQGTVALPEMRRGRVALSFVTVVARSTGRTADHIDFASPVQAYAIAQTQLAYYRALEAGGHVRLLTGRDGLDRHMAEWEAWDAGAAAGDTDTPPLGFVLLMESADPILRPEQLEAWWLSGLRMVGPAHFGPGRYAGGTGTEVGLTEPGRALLGEMERLGMPLDLTHLSDPAFWEALDHFGGPVLASHSNCRALVPNGRQFTDEQLLAIAERDGVVGLLISCSDLVPGWVVGAGHNGDVMLALLVDHIDHICQLTGSARHIAIGSRDLDTIADLQKLPTLLADRGYGEADIAAILHGNWLRYLRTVWPA